jgi:hypothetical protein
MDTWPEGWYAPERFEIYALEAQLSREVGDGHPLKGVAARLLARAHVSDDALFTLGDGRVALVHLTWKQSGPETDPRWPVTHIFASRDEWLSFMKAAQ